MSDLAQGLEQGLGVVDEKLTQVLRWVGKRVVTRQ